jgi:hypothetical protein
MSSFVMNGIDGSNLVGFLAALGTLQALSHGHSHVRMAWIADSWHPTISCDAIETREELLKTLGEKLGVGTSAPSYIQKWPNLPKTGGEFAAFILEQRHDPRAADFLASMGSATREQGEGVGDTAFRTMGGAGHQDFLGFMSQIWEQTSAEQLESTLFDPWLYQDTGLAMRWDSVDYRPHALRAENPSSSKNKPTSVRGANRLAIEALSLFPVLPAMRINQTTGFGCPTARHFTWMIWEPLLTIEEIRSVLSRGPALKNEDNQAGELSSLGVQAIFRAERFTEGKFRNFTPSVQVY